MAKAQPYNYPFESYQWTDSQGRTWVIEKDPNFPEEKQKQLKEGYPFQNYVDNPRTRTRMNNIYAKIHSLSEPSDILNSMFAAISWFLDPEFRTRTFVYELENKLPMLNGNDKIAVEFAIKAINEKGSVPKKLKVAYGLANGSEKDTD